MPTPPATFTPAQLRAEAVRRLRDHAVGLGERPVARVVGYVATVVADEFWDADDVEIMAALMGVTVDRGEPTGV